MTNAKPVFFQKHIIAVLGNGLIKKDNSQQLPQHVNKRLDKTIELFSHLHDKPTIVLLGKWSFWNRLGPLPSTTEAEEMGKYLLAKDIPSESIYLEKQSEDTIGNALFLKSALKEAQVNHITVILADYHRERAEYIFHRVFGSDFRLDFIETEGPFHGADLEKEKHVQRDLLVSQKPFLEKLLQNLPPLGNLYDNPYYRNQIEGHTSFEQKEASRSAMGISAERNDL